MLGKLVAVMGRVYSFEVVAATRWAVAVDRGTVIDVGENGKMSIVVV